MQAGICPVHSPPLIQATSLEVLNSNYGLFHNNAYNNNNNNKESHQSNPSNSPEPFSADVSWIDHCLFLISGKPKASETYTTDKINL